MDFTPIPQNFQMFCNSRPPDLNQGIRGLGFELSGVGYASMIPVPPWTFSFFVVFHWSVANNPPKHGCTMQWKAPFDEPYPVPPGYDQHGERLLDIGDRPHVYRADQSCQSAVHAGAVLTSGGYLYVAPWGERALVLSIGMMVKEPEFSNWLNIAKWDGQGNPTFQEQPEPQEPLRFYIPDNYDKAVILFRKGRKFEVKMDKPDRAVFKAKE